MTRTNASNFGKYSLQQTFYPNTGICFKQLLTRVLDMSCVRIVLKPA